MVFQIGDEGRAGQIECQAAPILLVPAEILPLEQEAPLERRDQFLRAADKVGVVRFRAARQADDRAMMKVVVPLRVESIASLVRPTNANGLLRLILGDQKNGPPMGCLARVTRQRREKMLVGIVENGLRRIKPQAV